MAEVLEGDAMAAVVTTEEVPLTCCGCSATRIGCPATERLAPATAAAMAVAGEAVMERLQGCYY